MSDDQSITVLKDQLLAQVRLLEGIITQLMSLLQQSEEAFYNLPPVTKNVQVGEKGGLYYTNRRGKRVYLKEWQRDHCKFNKLAGQADCGPLMTRSIQLKAPAVIPTVTVPGVPFPGPEDALAVYVNRIVSSLASQVPGWNLEWNKFILGKV